MCSTVVMVLLDLLDLWSEKAVGCFGVVDVIFADHTTVDIQKRGNTEINTYHTNMNKKAEIYHRRHAVSPAFSCMHAKQQC